MPTKKRTSSTSAPRPRKLVRSSSVYPVTPAHAATCHGCDSLPAGSMEVAAILLVLVFSLSAVLFTSIYATQVQTQKVQVLEAQISSYQQVR